MYIYPGINKNQINNRMLGSYFTYICIITAYYGVFGGKLKVFILVMVYYTSTSCFPFSVLNAIILCNGIMTTLFLYLMQQDVHRK